MADRSFTFLDWIRFAIGTGAAAYAGLTIGPTLEGSIRLRAVTIVWVMCLTFGLAVAAGLAIEKQVSLAFEEEV